MESHLIHSNAVLMVKGQECKGVTWFQPPPPCEMGGPEILVASSPHFKQVFFLMMGGPGLMGGPTFQMGGSAVLTFIISSLCDIGF